MGNVVRVGSLEIDQDLEFQRREWRLERVAWAFGALIVLCAVGGLFGSGPLSSTEAGAGGRLSVGYERFLRFGSHNRLTLRAESGGPLLRVDVSSAYLARMRLERIVPQPRRVATVPGWTQLEFETAPGGPIEILLDFEPSRRGAAAGTLRVEGASVPVWQFVYP